MESYIIAMRSMPFPRPILRVNAFFSAINTIVDVNIFILTTKQNSDSFTLVPWYIKKMVSKGECIDFISIPDWVLKRNHRLFVKEGYWLFQDFFRLTFNCDLELTIDLLANI